MSNEALATEPTKTTLENSVTWFLADKLQTAATPIATKKFLTSKNELVYLTKCNVAELSVPQVKVQVFERVTGGVRETGYQLFSNHRFAKYINEMVFGTEAGTAKGEAGDKQEDVTESEASKLVELVNSLGNARQTL